MKTAEECNKESTSASDYTIFVENIPKEANIDYEAELKVLFESLLLKDGQEKVLKKAIVEKIVLCYDIRGIDM